MAHGSTQAAPAPTSVDDHGWGRGDVALEDRSKHEPAVDAHAETAPGRPGLHFGWWLAAITLGGLAVRLTYLLVWRNPSEIVGDPYYYHQGANLLADGQGYIHPYQYLLFDRRLPGADHPPGYLTVLAGFSWLGLRSFFQHQVISCLLGSGGVVCMGLAGRRIAGARVGLIVAALTALSPNVFFFDAHVLSETLVVSTTALVLLAAYRWWDRPTTQAACLFGVAVGVAALVRSEALLLGPVIAVPLVWWRARGDTLARGLRHMVLAGAAAAVVIAPWVGYNMARFERPTTLSAQFDQTLGTANCDDVYYGDRVGYWSLPCIQRTEHLVGDGDASAQGRGFARIARQYMRDHADRVPYVVAARVGRTFALYQPQNQIKLDKSVESKELGLGQAGLFTWFAVAVAGGFGLVGLRRAGRAIFPLVATVASVAVTVAIIYGNTRFRLPAELALMIPAAVSIDAALSAYRARRRRNHATVAPAEPTAVSARDDTRGHSNNAAPAVAAARGDLGVPSTPADPTLDPPGGLGSSTGRFAGFDGLRAVAALGVLLTHVGLQSGYVGRNQSGPWISRADVGVALFFVLSGFLLYRPFVARRLDGRPPGRTRDYLRGRFLRIYPAYWLALTVLVVVLDVRGRDDIKSLWDYVMYYGLLQSYSAKTALGGLQQAWTLTNEVAFYLLLPVWAAAAAWLFRRLSARRAVLTELVVLGLAAAGSLSFTFWVQTHGGGDPALGSFDPRLHWLIANFHLFVPGMALAVALEWSVRRDRPLRVLEAARRHPWICWGLAGACFWIVATQLDLGLQVGAAEPGQAVGKEILYGAVGFFLVLPVALAGATLTRSMRWLGSRPMVVLGVLSYGIYLWHEGVIDVYRDIRKLPELTGSFPVMLVVVLAASVAVAGVSYLLVERPALRLKDRRRRLFGGWRPVGLPADARLAEPVPTGATR